MSNYYNSPYYTVYDGINQVNNHGGKQPKTRVKEKNILLLHKYNSNCITKSSTSFHLGGLSLHIRCGGVPFLRNKLVAHRIRNIWHKFRKWLRYQPHKTYLRGK
jgi:hypothetical protein